MPLQLAQVSQNVYGYDAVTDKGEVEQDAIMLYKRAVPKRRLYMIGGTHGYEPSGVPVRQTQAEKRNSANKYEGDTATIGGRTITSFALEDHDIRRFNNSMKFTYKNIAKLCGSDGEINAIKTADLIQTIRKMDYSGDWLILLTWCFSVNWARSEVL